MLQAERMLECPSAILRWYRASVYIVVPSSSSSSNIEPLHAKRTTTPMAELHGFQNVMLESLKVVRCGSCIVWRPVGVTIMSVDTSPSGRERESQNVARVARHAH